MSTLLTKYTALMEELFKKKDPATYMTILTSSGAFRWNRDGIQHLNEDTKEFVNIKDAPEYAQEWIREALEKIKE